MRIAVCCKAVPSQKVGIDPHTGNINRSEAGCSVNMYDYAAVETALRVKDSFPDTEILVFSMGPEGAGEALREILSLGADQAFLICDPAFRGSDVLATSLTLAKALTLLGPFDLILCGKQTSDGDTAQVSGELAARLKIPYIPWVTNCVSVSRTEARVVSEMDDCLVTWKTSFPALMSVDPRAFTVRTASLTGKIQSRRKEIPLLTRALLELPEDYSGAGASATRVIRGEKLAVIKGKTPARLTPTAFHELALSAADPRKAVQS